jgi:DNA uptake protein ComE-like DNA-binding protein
MPSLPQLWTISQRRVVLGIVVVLLAYLAIEYHLNPTQIPDPQPPQGTRYDELADRLDPNTADAAALAAIPQLGEKKAQQIVEYRDDFVKSHHGQLAFNEPRDLLKIKGIGVSTMNNMDQYLVFPSQSATTRPSD